MKVPILRIKKLLLTSVQMELSDRDALEFQDDVLRMVAQTEAEGIVIDITGLEVVDSFMARVLNETAAMVRLLGAEAVVCGMRPAVAMTLVEMGREMVDVATALNLELGLEKLQKLVDARRAAGGAAAHARR
ncbi:MAG: STAS domain-containing protein [Acidobacteriota bacterium]